MKNNILTDIKTQANSFVIDDSLKPIISDKEYNDNNLFIEIFEKRYSNEKPN